MPILAINIWNINCTQCKKWKNWVLKPSPKYFWHVGHTTGGLEGSEYNLNSCSSFTQYTQTCLRSILSEQTCGLTHKFYFVWHSLYNHKSGGIDI